MAQWLRRGIANPLVVVRRRASSTLASSASLYEMVSNSGEGLVVPYGNSKSLLDGRGQRHKRRLDVGNTLIADSFTGFYRYIASRRYEHGAEAVQWGT